MCSHDLVVLHMQVAFPQHIPLKQEACKRHPAQQAVSILQVLVQKEEKLNSHQPCSTAACIVYSICLDSIGIFFKL